MKLTLSWSPSEIENILSRISFGNKDPTIDLIAPDPEVVHEWKEEIITKVINLPPIFDTKIERITSIPKPIELEKEIKWKTFRNMWQSHYVDITFSESWEFYKRFVSAAAASHYFGKSNLNENLKKWFGFHHNGIWFNIKYSNNVCK